MDTEGMHSRCIECKAQLNSGKGRVTRIEINGLRLVPTLGNLLLLGHVCLACVSTVRYKDIGNIKKTNGFNRENKSYIKRKRSY